MPLRDGFTSARAMRIRAEKLKKQPSPPVGELFVFVDECHRTQSGNLHKTIKAMLSSGVSIGFTGAP